MATPEEMIAQALGRTQAAMNVPPVQPAAVPGISTGQPLVDDATLRALVARAFAGNPTQPQDDLSSARMRMWSAMAQPRQQGQSTAGNITAAMQGGVSSIDAANEVRRAQAMDQVKIASALAGQDAARRQTEMAMKMQAAKFTPEMEQLRLQIEALKRTGAVEKAQQLEKLLRTDPELVKQKLQDELSKGAAETDLKKAQAEEARSKAAFADRGGTPKGGMTPVGDGTFLKYRTSKDGQVEVSHVIPGNANYTEEMARKELLDRAKKAAPWYKPGMLVADPTSEEIKALVAERKAGKVTPFVSQDGNTPTTPLPGAPATPTPGVDLTGLVRSKTQGKAQRQASGKIKQLSNTPQTPVKSPSELQSSMQIPIEVQKTRDLAAIDLIEKSLQDPDNTPEDVAMLQRDLAFRRQRFQKVYAGV